MKFVRTVIALPGKAWSERNSILWLASNLPSASGYPMKELTLLGASPSRHSHLALARFLTLA